jgi:hypothetical protein
MFEHAILPLRLTKTIGNKQINLRVFTYLPSCHGMQIEVSTRELSSYLKDECRTTKLVTALSTRYLGIESALVRESGALTRSGG